MCLLYVSMAAYVKVQGENNPNETELPVGEDDALSFRELEILHPGAVGLKYTLNGVTRLIKEVDGKLLPPPGGWGNYVYECIYRKAGEKRKGEDLDDSVTKIPYLENARHSDGMPLWTYTDLVVLGLPWKTTDQGLHDYFSQFGELQFAQVKYDPVTGKSKGFGFIRFVDAQAQVSVMLQRHQIDGRWCEVRIPFSKDTPTRSRMPTKIFVGLCTEDMTETVLRNYFQKFGDVSDVYVPNPFRGFAFVAYSNPECVQRVCRMVHVINNRKVNVTEAVPRRSKEKYDQNRIEPSKSPAENVTYIHKTIGYNSDNRKAALLSEDAWSETCSNSPVFVEQLLSTAVKSAIQGIAAASPQSLILASPPPPPPPPPPPLTNE